jgi:hypothetical protein
MAPTINGPCTAKFLFFNGKLPINSFQEPVHAAVSDPS